MKRRAAERSSTDWDLRTLTPDQKINTMRILHRLMGTSQFTEAFISAVSAPNSDNPDGANVRVRITFNKRTR